MANNSANIQASSNKKKLILYTFIEILCLFILCIVGGVFDFLNLGWTIDKILTWDYWKGCIQQFILYSCSMILGYMSTLEKEDIRNKEYFNLMSRYRELLKSKKQSFSIFIETVFNPKTKKQFIFFNNQKKLYKLDKHSKDEWKISYNKAIHSGKPLSEYPDYIINDTDTYMVKRDKKRSYVYAVRRQLMEKLITPEYIEENWSVISVKYPYVHAESFTSSLSIHYEATTEYKVENTTGKDIVKLIPMKLVSTLLVAIIFACIVYEPNIGQLGNQISIWIAIILKYLMRCGMMIINFVMGLWNARKMFQENYILPIQNRIRILLEYITWCHDTHQEDTWSDKVVLAYQERQEQLDKLDSSKKELKSLLDKVHS